MNAAMRAMPKKQSRRMNRRLSTFSRWREDYNLDDCNARLSAAGRFAAAGHADLFLEPLEPDRADHDLLADHIARRAVHAHGLGEFEVLLDGGLHLGACQILVEPRHVDAGILGGGQRMGLVGRSAATEQLLVEVEILLAARVL